MIWRVLPLVKINTRISEIPCIMLYEQKVMDSKIGTHICTTLCIGRV
jgi:hypothetical protein